jgi:hypothetical protein
MTIAQLDHLNRIKRHLETLLANAERRTPGEWRRPGWLPDSMYLGSSPDSAFIASCAGNAEAGWKSTLGVINRYYDSGICREWQGYMRTAIEPILAAWPIELLKIPLATSAASK